MKRTSVCAVVLASVALSAGPVGAAAPVLDVAAQGPSRTDAASVHDGLAFRATQRLKVVCPEGEPFVVRVQVTQLSGARSLTGVSGVTCTGRTQHLVLPLSLGPGSTRLPLDLAQDADLSAALVSLSGAAGAQDVDRTRLVQH